MSITICEVIFSKFMGAFTIGILNLKFSGIIRRLYL